ncbi:leucine--tRNA ligase [Pseudomonas sp. CVAP|uniref:leucine--tRNA ligase n=1 Tax=Pseudomonas sp. CVAP\|nr:leucine--tRNA ligase [Pseudomonas sp. CVAP\
MTIHDTRAMEEKWLARWEQGVLYSVSSDLSRPKYYCLDMFPYPSGAGLHVGHPRGYIATDIYSRYKRMLGYNVLHPMGFDSFGLPAEQYAIETGQHPKITTDNNIFTFKAQLRKLGFCYDPEREIKTSDAGYYHWTQWIFSQLFNSWYDIVDNKAKPITELISHLEASGNTLIAASSDADAPVVTALQWRQYSKHEQSDFLMKYRLAYRADSYVNWCPELGTVLANDEVKDGFSERGGHPVHKKKMKQWMLRIGAYADRLLDGLSGLDWPDALKDMQRHWIGKSQGAEISFQLAGANSAVRVFTSHPETLYGCTFLVLAPEHELVESITSEAFKEDVAAYLEKTSFRSERDRLTGVDQSTGQFTGTYGVHPLTGEYLPIWVADYVLADYGTGAIMGVPCSDSRDFLFAKTFDLPIKYIYEGAQGSEAPYEYVSGNLIDSNEATGLSSNAAKDVIMAKLVETGRGVQTVSFRIRDAIFGRQRYWGEPIPVFYDHDGIPDVVPDHDLPVVLPDIEAFLPTNEGEPPLDRAKNWNYHGQKYETTTMPGWAGSSWYFLRYMDPRNDARPVSPENIRYWQSVDLYVGGAEHATGHLLYSRFWTHFLKDRGLIDFEEPFKKVLCQGMILGVSAIIYRDKVTHQLISADIKGERDVQPLYIDIRFVDDSNLVNVDALRSWRRSYEDADFIFNEGVFLCDRLTEKMSKSKHNVEIPDDLVERYGADTFRLHEMFLGPIEQTATWSTQSIDGPYKFLQKVGRLFQDESGNSLVEDGPANGDELKAVHTAIAKVGRLTGEMSYNTAIAALMICVNKLTSLKCHKKEVLEIVLKLLHPYAPFITEELWSGMLHNSDFLLNTDYPIAEERFLIEPEFECPVSIDGKLRLKLMIRRDLTEVEVRALVLAEPTVQRWLENKEVKKFIFVPEKIVNIVSVYETVD